MELQILGTGSSGNCYHLKPKNGNGILIDCGLAYKQIAQNIDISSLDGVLVGHSHGDHSKAVKDFQKRGIYACMTDETTQALNLGKKNRIFPLNRFKLGSFTVLPFELVHDVHNVGFFIHHMEIGNLLYITDTTYCKYKFKDINHIMIEANFCDEIIGDDFLTSRIYKSHMSIKNCIKFLQANDLSEVKTITLIHLSDRNSNAKEFKEKVQKATGKHVEIAENGLVINL